MGKSARTAVLNMGFRVSHDSENACVGLMGRTYCLHLKGLKKETARSSERWYLPTRPHGVTAQKTKIDNTLNGFILFTHSNRLEIYNFQFHEWS